MDFTQYDRDENGEIDNVFIFYAGRGENSGGPEDSIWPHTWVAEYGYRFDGKRLNGYGCTNEWMAPMDGWPAGRPDGIGPFTHEFCHILGLPDLYPTKYPDPLPFTQGAWSLMDKGPYNNSCCTPPEMEIFGKYALDWWEPKELPIDGDIRLAPLADGDEGYILRTERDEEYFLIENRQKKGWDEYIPGHGMLLWHVDYNWSVWYSKGINNVAAHQYVDIVEADGVLTEATRAGDSFPGTEKVTALNGTTEPALKSWSGYELPYVISDIQETPEGILTFRVGRGAEATYGPGVLPAEDVTPRGFTARWEAKDGALSYRLRVFTRAGEEELTARGYDYRNVGNVTEAIVTGLEPTTEYFYTIKAEDATSMSLPSEAMAVTTADVTPEYVMPRLGAPQDVTETSFRAVWEPEEGCDDYILNVWQRRLSDEAVDAETFDGKQSRWTTNSSYFYSSDLYAGASTPSLRLKADEYIMTPMSEAGRQKALKFWYRGRNVTENTKIQIAGYAHDSWVVFEEIPVSDSRDGETIEIMLIPADATTVRVMPTDPEGNVQIYTDDFYLTTAAEEELIGVDKFTDFHVGNVSSYLLEGLRSGEEYFYSVTAVTAGVESMPSHPGFMRMDGKVGVSELVREEESQVRVESGDIICRGEAMWRLYDLQGRLLGERSNESDQETHFTMEDEGVYILNCITPKGTKIIKLTI